MNKKIISALVVAAVGLGAAAGAEAQFGNLGKAIKKEAKKKKKKAKRDLGNVTSGQSPANISGGGSSGPLGKPAASLTKFTKCAGFAMSNITIGKLGSYTFQQGFSSEKRTGFINRRPAKADGCILTTGLQKDEVLYFEVNESYRKTKSGNNYTLQCVNSNNPSGGTVSLHGTNGSSDRYLGTSAMKLACGNSEGLSDCANGSNSDRAKAFTNDLKRRGKYGASFLARGNDDSARGQSKRLYCQYYNKDNGKSLVAFEMISKSPYD